MKFAYIFALLAIAIIIYMIFLLVRISKSSFENKKILSAPICVATVAIFSYTFFLLSRKYLPALFFNEIYYICTDWMTFTLFVLFSANMEIPGKKKVRNVFFVVSVFDSISLLVNTFTKHSFDISPSITSFGMHFWWLNFTPLHYIHLGFCYVMAMSAFIVLVRNSVRSPKFYKRKYLFFLAAYLIVLLCNFHSYSTNLPIDYSVLLYGVFATFIAVYSTSTFPLYLLINVMGKVSESASDAIVHFDYDGNVIYENLAAKKLFDLKTGVLKMSPVKFKNKYMTGKNDQKSVKWENGNVIFTMDLSFRYNDDEDENADDEEKYFRVIYQDLKIENTVVGSYIKISDKTEEKLRFQKEKYSATHDELTGLLNRAGFFEEIERQLKLKTFKNPVMICSNIKDFKFVNEIFGESVGDEILLKHAKILKEKAQKNDINGRLGDDKFAIFMEKKHFNPEVFEKEFRFLGHAVDSVSYQIYISAGVYEVHDLTESVQLMYDKAKVAMDTIKNDYLNTIAFYDSVLMDKLLAAKHIVNNFENAIDSDEFEVYFQPIFDSRGKVRSAEALARWCNSDLGIVYPADFIEILENTGLIYKLDKIVCEKAVAQFAEWKKKNYGIKTIAFNANSKDEYYFDTISFLQATVKKYGISPDSLIIEVKEDALINDYENGSHFFERMKEAGFKVSIDDFGSGYSSLNMLKDFNVDAVKISADFFSGNEFSSRSEIILRSMLEMVKDLNIEAAALGIENETQKKLLSDLGCSVFQGFLFSKPLPADEFEEKFLKT